MQGHVVSSHMLAHTVVTQVIMCTAITRGLVCLHANTRTHPLVTVGDIWLIQTSVGGMQMQVQLMLQVTFHLHGLGPHSM